MRDQRYPDALADFFSVSVQRQRSLRSRRSLGEAVNGDAYVEIYEDLGAAGVHSSIVAKRVKMSDVWTGRCPSPKAWINGVVKKTALREIIRVPTGITEICSSRGPWEMMIYVSPDEWWDVRIEGPEGRVREGRVRLRWAGTHYDGCDFSYVD